MSLIADISVNRIINVGTVGIQRIEGGTSPDDVNTYKYTVEQTSRATGEVETVAEGLVSHRYGDSGTRLLLKVLLDAERHL